VTGSGLFRFGQATAAEKTPLPEILFPVSFYILPFGISAALQSGIPSHSRRSGPAVQAENDGKEPRKSSSGLRGSYTAAARLF